MTARTLTLIAKIIQNLANLSEFEKKEPHMSYCNSFINKHMHEMREFINNISVNIYIYIKLLFIKHFYKTFNFLLNIYAIL